MKHMIAGLLGNIRNMIGLGVVSTLDDTGGAKTVNFASGAGVNRADVEVADPWGFSASPPADGMITLFVQIGADPANIMALPPGNPSCRFGGLLVGEAVVYGADGSRVHIRQGGIVDIWGGSQVNLHTKNVTINAPSGCTINGPVTLNGNVQVDGNLTASGLVTDSRNTL